MKCKRTRRTLDGGGGGGERRVDIESRGRMKGVGEVMKIRGRRGR